MKHTHRKLFPVLFSCTTGDSYFTKTCLFAICIILFTGFDGHVTAAEPPIPSFGSNSFLPLITLNNPETFPENGSPLPDSLLYQQLGQQQARANSNTNSFQVQPKQQQQQFPQVSNIGIGGGFGSQSDSSGQNNGFIASQQFQPQQNSFQPNNINNINNGGFSQPLSFEGTNNLENTNVNSPVYSNDFQQTNPIRNDASNSNTSPLKRPRNDVLLQQQPTNSGPLQIQTDGSGGFPLANSQINNNNNIGGGFQQSQPQQQQQQNFPVQGNDNNKGFNPSFSNQYNNFQQQPNIIQEQRQLFPTSFQSSNTNNNNNNNNFNNNLDNNIDNINNNNNNLGSFQPNQNQNFPQQQSQSTGFPSGSNNNINSNNGNNGFQQQGSNLAFNSQQQQPFNDNSNSEFSSFGSNTNQLQQNNVQQQPSGFQQSDNFNNNNNNNNNNFQSQNPIGNFVNNQNSNQNSLSPQIGSVNGNNRNNNNNNGGGSTKQVVNDTPLIPSQTSNEISAKIPQGVQQTQQQNGIIDDNVVKGQYRVGLPDGRTQIVRYIALVTYKKENGGAASSSSTSSQQVPFSSSVGSQSTPLGALGSSSNVVVRGVRPVPYNYRGPLNDERTEPYNNLPYPNSFSFGGRIPRKVKRRLKLTPPKTTPSETTEKNQT